MLYAIVFGKGWLKLLTGKRGPITSGTLTYRGISWFCNTYLFDFIFFVRVTSVIMDTYQPQKPASGGI